MSLRDKSLIVLVALLGVVLQPLAAETDDWFGQGQPFGKPMPFAPKMLKSVESALEIIELHSAPVFSPNGELMLIEQQKYNKQKKAYSNQILISTKSVSGWSTLKPVSFSGTANDVTPRFHPDGQRLFFASDRGETASQSKADKNIWFVERKGKGWGKPQKLGAKINSSVNESSPVFNGKGDLYFSRKHPRDKGYGEVYVSRFNNKDFQEPKALSAINSAAYEFPTVVAPDDRWLIFGSSRGIPKNAEKAGLYFSRNLGEDRWSQPVMLPSEINGHGLVFSASVTPGGDYFLFLNRHFGGLTKEVPEGIYWLSSRFLDPLINTD